MKPTPSILILLVLTVIMTFSHTSFAGSKRSKRKCQQTLEADLELMQGPVDIRGDRVRLLSQTIEDSETMAFFSDPAILDLFFSVPNQGQIPEHTMSLYQEASGLGWVYSRNNRGEYELSIELPFYSLPDEKFAGFINAFVTEDSKSLMQVGLAILPEFRGQGLGKSVIKHFSRYVKDSFPKVEILQAEISERNPPSLSLFGSSNFQLVGERKGGEIKILQRVLRSRR